MIYKDAAACNSNKLQKKENHNIWEEVEEREALLKETIKSDMQRLRLFELQAAESRELQYMPRRNILI